ncbi:MAG: hypothetical protein Q7J68_07595 [Thermoplasmata archaeon]|nr:hypothetical protein [Thermoplasmata archaeon]
MKGNLYKHEIELVDLDIKNQPREEFREHLKNVKYRGYEVEQLTDGRKIVITKPGGKSFYGNARREDFMVWIYNPKDSSLWLISHKDISNDIELKGNINPKETIKLIDTMERVFNGEEPSDVLETTKLNSMVGEPPDVLLKAYKWIWGQEDCNYPTGEGREMSMKIIRELRNKLRRE